MRTTDHLTQGASVTFSETLKLVDTSITENQARSIKNWRMGVSDDTEVVSQTSLSIERICEIIKLAQEFKKN